MALNPSTALLQSEVIEHFSMAMLLTTTKAAISSLAEVCSPGQGPPVGSAVAFLFSGVLAGLVRKMRAQSRSEKGSFLNRKRYF